jgi:outer membrane protein assembly factor BamE
MKSTPLAHRLFAYACLLGALHGCASFEQVGSLVPTALTPYSIDIVQGNVVTSEQLAALQIGAPRAQVLAVLGTPLLASPFHAQRWDYTFTIKRQGVPSQERHVTVLFKDDRLERVQADPLPSEADFVASLRKPGSLPEPKPLEATDASMAKYPLPAPSQANAPVLPAPSVSSYPPLEPLAR